MVRTVSMDGLHFYRVGHRLPRSIKNFRLYQGEPDLGHSRIFPSVIHRVVTSPVLVLLALAVLLLATGPVGAQTTASTMQPAGPVAELQNNLFWLVFWIGAGIFVTVVSILLYAMIRFRARRGDEKRIPKQIEGSTALEIAWTIIPVILVIIIAVPTVQGIFELSSPPEDAETMAVTVTGHQWWWEFEYPEYGIVTANELHIPTGKVIDISLISNDVIHSFWVPNLAGKMDVNPMRDEPLPGSVNKMWFQADRPGVYFGQCAEFCGVNHATMRFRVVAHEPEDFEAWLEGRELSVATASLPITDEEYEGHAELVATGRQLFATRCASCHLIEGAGFVELPREFYVGPSLTQIGSRLTIAAGTLENTPENLAAWLRNPTAFKPDTLMDTVANMRLSADEVDALVAFLHSQK